MKNLEQTMKSIFDVSTMNPEIESAKAYGITKTSEGDLISKLIDYSPDVYDLIEKINDDKSFANYEYFSFLTTGWAAPLNKDGEVEGRPSEHELRRRVTLVICADIKNKEVMGSVLEFQDAPEDKVFDYNQATGSLADAISSIFQD